MIRYAAYCDDPIAFLAEKATNTKEAKKYPGMSFVPLLKHKLGKIGIPLVTADTALSKITHGQWKAAEVALISVGASQLSSYLISRGAVPAIVFSGESPLWIPELYLKFHDFTGKFRYRFFFEEIYRTFAERRAGDFHFYFPCFSVTQKIKTPAHYSQKKFLAAVLANKFYDPSASQTWKLRIKRWVKRLLLLIYTAHAKMGFKHGRIWGRRGIFFAELHNRRLRLLDFFAGKQKIDLFGKGWGNITNLPAKVIPNLQKNLHLVSKGGVLDKIGTLQNYKFTLCLENMRYPSYVTEKIIDCFIAGSIPLYLGAPDVSKYIPSDCYVDISSFRTENELFDFIHSMPEQTYQACISAGKKFLLSTEGRKYSYEHKAEEFYKAIQSLIQA
jgi:hypothetical protein